jgi:hypothetical protein
MGASSDVNGEECERIPSPATRARILIPPAAPAQPFAIVDLGHSTCGRLVALTIIASTAGYCRLTLPQPTVEA